MSLSDDERSHYLEQLEQLQEKSSLTKIQATMLKTLNVAKKTSKQLQLDSNEVRKVTKCRVNGCTLVTARCVEFVFKDVDRDDVEKLETMLKDDTIVTRLFAAVQKKRTTFVSTKSPHVLEFLGHERMKSECNDFVAVIAFEWTKIISGSTMADFANRVLKLLLHHRPTERNRIIYNDENSEFGINIRSLRDQLSCSEQWIKDAIQATKTVEFLNVKPGSGSDFLTSKKPILLFAGVRSTAYKSWTAMIITTLKAVFKVKSCVALELMRKQVKQPPRKKPYQRPKAGDEQTKVPRQNRFSPLVDPRYSRTVQIVSRSRM